MQRLLIILGIVLIAVGVLWPLVQRFGIGRLPGDIVLEWRGFTFYFPIVTSLIVSVLVSLLFWFLSSGR
jgi:hypothetical protein